MTDLGTRLRALADTSDDELDTYSHVVTDGWTGQLFKLARQQASALREAADALETVERTCHERNCIGLDEEVSDLKAKLAEEQRLRYEFETANRMFAGVAKERDEALAKLATAEGDSDEEHHWVVYWTSRAEKAEAEAAALREALITIRTVAEQVGLSQTWAIGFTKEALSQPGPGAALLEDYRRTQRDYSELFESRDLVLLERNQLQERVKKLEAVVGAAKGQCMLPGALRDALAALEEKS